MTHYTLLLVATSLSSSAFSVSQATVGSSLRFVSQAGAACGYW